MQLGTGRKSIVTNFKIIGTMTDEDFDFIRTMGNYASGGHLHRLDLSEAKIDKINLEGCDALLEIILPTDLQEIDKEAVKGCRNLAEIEMGDNITGIGNQAFIYCTSLKKVTIGANIQSIGEETFCNDDNIETITIKQSNPPILSENTFPDADGIKLIVPKGSNDAYWFAPGCSRLEIEEVDM